MVTVYEECPVCKDEVEFGFVLHRADDGDFPVAEEIHQNCECSIDLEALEIKASKKYYDAQEAQLEDWD